MLHSWSQSEEMNETKLELKQPFASTLGQLSLHTLSHLSMREQRSSQQVSCHNFWIFLSLSGKYFFGCSWVEIFFGGGDVYVFNFADPSVMEKRSPGQRLPQLEQTVAEQLQQGAGMCSVLDTTGG